MPRLEVSPAQPPMSDIVFFRYTQYFNDISFDAIYRDIFMIFSKYKLAQNTPKFLSWSAYVNIFCDKMAYLQLLKGFFRDKMAYLLLLKVFVH